MLDVAVIAAYLAGVTLFGLSFRRKQGTLKDYFLAGNTIPWWAISLSIMAAETSTLTVISIPGLAYDKDFRFLQLVMGYLAGRVIVSFLFIPRYFRGQFVTAYQLMEVRFGAKLRMLTAGLFLLTRAAAEGVRIFAVAIVVRVALGSMLSGVSEDSRDIWSIAIVCVMTLAYTFEGGLAAVIWTDVIQLGVYSIGTIVGFFTIVHQVPGGWHAIDAVALSAHKFRVLDLSWSLTSTYTLASGLIGGAFLTMASHGTDQLIVQRLLSARSERQSKLALLTSGVGIAFQFCLFLLIGTLLFVYYRQSPPGTAFSRTDTIYPTYIVTRMPHGISGLLISAILAAAMSNLSAALNSLSSTTIVDFYARISPLSSEARRVSLSRLATIVWGFALFFLALLARHGGRVLETGLSIASVAYGCVLGVFLLGVLTKSANESGAIVGLLFGLSVNLYLWLGTSISFAWYVVFGSVATFIVGYGASKGLSRGMETPSSAHALEKQHG
jgi:SSS family transporter